MMSRSNNHAVASHLLSLSSYPLSLRLLPFVCLLSSARSARVSLRLCICICLSTCLSVYLSVSLPVYLSACLSLSHVSIVPSISPSRSLRFTSVCLFVCISVIYSLLFLSFLICVSISLSSLHKTARPTTASKIRISSSIPAHKTERTSPAENTRSITPNSHTSQDDSSEFNNAISEYVTADSLKEASGTDDLNSVEYIELQADTSESSLARLGQLLPNLRELKLSASNITSIRDLGTALGNLEILWMPKCNLHDLNGVSMLSSLKELYLSFNNISECSPLSMLENVQVLDLEGNLIADQAQVEFLSLIPCLRSLNLEGNPLQQKYPSVKDYRRAVFSLLPNLEQLDDFGKDDLVPETADTHASLLIPKLLKQRTEGQDPTIKEGIRPGTARPLTQQSVRPRTASAALHRDASLGGDDDDDEDDVTDGSSELTHGSEVAFQGPPLKALLARRRQAPLSDDVDGTPLDTLLMSVGLYDERVSSEDAFAGMTREQVFDELRSWREKFAALSISNNASNTHPMSQAATRDSKAVVAPEAQQANTTAPRRRPETARPAKTRQMPAPSPFSQSVNARMQPHPPKTTQNLPAPPAQRPQTTAGVRLRRLRSMPGRRLPELRPLSAADGGVESSTTSASSEQRQLPRPPPQLTHQARRPNRSAHL
eukprot:m.175951 g.175951  ORF g.175951 m.175951 type:complete len:658 (+) comp16552_c11_seq2:447-2420(+)